MEKINEALPGSIELIDKETALYKGSTEEINKNIEARKNEIKAIAAKEQAQKAASAQLSLLDKSGFTSIEEAEKELEKWEAEYRNERDAQPSGGISGLFSDFINDYNFVPQQIAELENLIASYNEYESKISSWLSDGGSFTSTESTSGSYLDDILSGSSGKTPAEKALEQYQTARKKLEHQLAMDEITEAAFYSRLETISAQYLAGYTELEDERNRVQEEAYQYRKKLNEQMLKDAEEARKKELSNLKEFTDTVISLAEEEANAKIAAIDAELAAGRSWRRHRKRTQLQQAKAKLVFTRDEDSRESLQREIARLQSEIDKQNTQAQADAQKAAIQQQIDALKASTAATIAGYQNQLMPESVNPYVSQLAPNITVNAPACLLLSTAADRSCPAKAIIRDVIDVHSLIWECNGIRLEFSNEADARIFADLDNVVSNASGVFDRRSARVLTVQEPMLLHCPVHRSPLKGLCSLTIWAHAAGLSTGC